MSKKSILYSVFAILSGAGLLLATTFLFAIEWILGVVGIVLVLVVPGVLVRKAIVNANGVFDKLLAKFITPILIVVAGAFTLLYIFVWMP